MMIGFEAFRRVRSGPTSVRLEPTTARVTLEKSVGNHPEIASEPNPFHTLLESIGIRPAIISI